MKMKIGEKVLEDDIELVAIKKPGDSCDGCYYDSGVEVGCPEIDCAGIIFVEHEEGPSFICDHAEKCNLDHCSLKEYQSKKFWPFDCKYLKKNVKPIPFQSVEEVFETEPDIQDYIDSEGTPLRSGDYIKDMIEYKERLKAAKAAAAGEVR